MTIRTRVTMRITVLVAIQMRMAIMVTMLMMVYIMAVGGDGGNEDQDGERSADNMLQIQTNMRWWRAR